MAEKRVQQENRRVAGGSKALFSGCRPSSHPTASSTQPQWQPASGKQFSSPVAVQLNFLARWFSSLSLKLAKDYWLHVGGSVFERSL